jgi:hypothetical protein
VEKEIQDRWSAAEKAKQAAAKETSPEASGSPLKPVLTENGQGHDLSSKTSPSADEKPNKGFLDNWLASHGGSGDAGNAGDQGQA